MASPYDETLRPAAHAVVPPAFGSGRTLAGRYELGRELGRGSVGQVYAAFDRELGEQVAVKVIAVANDEALERVRSEVRLARRVTHRNAARTFDLGQTAGVHFITMELVQGATLAAKLKEGPLEAVAAANIGRQICQGLNAAHDVGVVHRDLKPANVMIAASGRVALTDFGVACALSEGDVLASAGLGAVVGTPAYMAPEQVRGDAISSAADMFAVGVMLFEMVAGTLPFPGGTVMAQLVSRLEDELAADKLECLPSELARWVALCLEREPERRPTAGSVAKGLAGFVAQQRSDSSGSQPSSDRWFVPIPKTAQSLAVLPFRQRALLEEEYLADALSDELVDLLSMTRGLRVLGVGATARYSAERDAQRMGRELGVEHVVDGAVDKRGDELRITVRLINAATGVQQWRSRFVGAVGDVFDLQDRIAQRVAESLRVELHLLQARECAPQAAVELYLRAKHLARESRASARSVDEAISLVDQCLGLAPDLAPAIALRAEAYMRRWSLPTHEAGHSLQETIARAVEAALVQAPSQPDTYVTAARFAATQGEFSKAARHLSAALAIAPTSATGHEYLGFLQCETGRTQEGIRHIRLARELDPTLQSTVATVLRALALQGDMHEFRVVLAEARSRPGGTGPLVSLIEMRVAAWHNDLEQVRCVPRYVSSDEHDDTPALIELVRRAYLSPEHIAEAAELLDHGTLTRRNPRITATMHQVAAELWALNRDVERAISHVERADEGGVLIDADWFERCPALESLRGHRGFRETGENARVRAEAIWHG